MRKVEILVLDFGSQYTQLIARRIREGGVYTRVVPYYESVDSIRSMDPVGLILSGGPCSVYGAGAYRPDGAIFELGIPVLGICYGMQYIVDFFGGRVERAQKQEYGRARVLIMNKLNNLFAGLDDSFHAFMSHADKVSEIPEDFSVLASSGNAEYCAIVHKQKRIFALQFHPEVAHTESGSTVLMNFAIRICKAKQTWNMGSFVSSESSRLREMIGDDKVLCAVSGGVDSTVVASLLHRAIGERLVSVFVDTGLLRAGERDGVVGLFECLRMPLHVIDASDLFLSRLDGVRDPERKRKIVGESFIEVFEREAVRFRDGVKYLAQGTLYSDVIESVSVRGPSKVIKSHHNVGGLPDRMDFELIEPLRELFKDEVRELGRELGLYDSVIMRHPFPGPGLAIRILGAVDRRSLDILRKCDDILIHLLKAEKLYDSVWQAFCVLLNVNSVGVMGDNRTYENTICIRCVNASDGMSASFSHLGHDFLERVSNSIINEVDGINRVVYDITSKPPGTIEWE